MRTYAQTFFVPASPHFTSLRSHPMFRFFGHNFLTLNMYSFIRQYPPILSNHSLIISTYILTRASHRMYVQSFEFDLWFALRVPIGVWLFWLPWEPVTTEQFSSSPNILLYPLSCTLSATGQDDKMIKFLAPILSSKLECLFAVLAHSSRYDEYSTSLPVLNDRDEQRKVTARRRSWTLCNPPSPSGMGFFVGCQPF
jgi:hypothetical protein